MRPRCKINSNLFLDPQFPKERRLLLMLIPILACISVCIACDQEGFLQKPRAQKALNSTCQQREGSAPNWIWCGDNIVAGSAVSQVCLGNASLTAHTATVLRFSSQEKNSEECWYSTNTAQEEAATSECSQIYVRKYEKDIATRIKSTDIVECYQEGLIVRVSGSLGGPREEFVAKRPSTK
jgi:hypothetical protein